MRALLDLPAPAKLNLFLHVVGRRADGYHLLQSVFVLIDWVDALHLERRDDGRLQRHDLGLALPADDLCLRAARALQRASGSALGADISIDKRVPWGAGLGGGSSDAATTLLGLNRLWGLAWPRERLLTLAATLGADVPFFVGGRNAVVEGVGERLTPIELPRAWYAVVKPASPLSTAAVFSSRLVGRSVEADIVTGSFADAIAPGAVADEWVCKLMSGHGRNDLQAAAEDRCDEVAQAAAWLHARCGNSRMTGSGSAVFARVGTGDQPEAAFPTEALPPGWEGRMCRSLTRHPLADWAG
ncbi:MAG TPA: 4-(cytidine 5'-diphospho)-2-C-methyl-D-erythritol kinase [Rubrivivax sp.]|nr:4-(cytidine 5'-diphospho)-2-C-methyl-D-erythritol kinase [Burkholderiales bacterium]HNT39631.1 4-(cytidine 5'-diphospho)-2-C-methyl-D-erythritol kinase [Rubrivivax sp.]